MTNRKAQVAGWLRQGLSPRRLALTLALGFAVGCLPVVGVPTALCALLALSLGLNQPAIQAANYAAMPLQILLIWPFVRMGRWLLSSAPLPDDIAHTPLRQMISTSGSLAGQALLAWLLFAVPVVLLLTFGLTPLLQRVPALAEQSE